MGQCIKMIRLLHLIAQNSTKAINSIIKEKDIEAFIDD